MKRAASLVVQSIEWLETYTSYIYAGIYGINFKYRSELEYKYSYFIFWGVILVIGLGMLWVIRKRKWF